jgi:hypothetical protein
MTEISLPHNSSRPSLTSPGLSIEYSFTVVVREEVFLLTKSQIEFDSPDSNLFKTSGAKTHTLNVDPRIFKIIFDYLAGETIMPIEIEAFPNGMEQALSASKELKLTKLKALLTTHQTTVEDVGVSRFLTLYLLMRVN